MKKIKDLKMVEIEEMVNLGWNGEFKTFLGSEIIRYKDANGKWHKLNEKNCHQKKTK